MRKVRSDRKVIQQIQSLERERSDVRGRALCYLLDFSARHRTYHVDGIAFDLKADLPARIATSLVSWRRLPGYKVHFVQAVSRHYQRNGEVLKLTPMPIARELQRIAKGRLDIANQARELMTDLNIGWLASVGVDTQIDTVRRFERDPLGRDWIAIAVSREQQHLAPAAREEASRVFHALSSWYPPVPPHTLALFATGALGCMSQPVAMSLVDLAARSDLMWRPFVVDAIAGTAERQASGPRNDALWTRAIEQLLAWMEDALLDEKTRLNSVLFAMRRVSASKSPNRDRLLKRIAASSGSRPFSEHMGLQAELRRLRLVKR